MSAYKISGQHRLELDLLTQLQRARSSVMAEELPQSNPVPANTFTDQLDSLIVTVEMLTQLQEIRSSDMFEQLPQSADQLDSLIAKLKSQVSIPLALSFSAASKGVFGWFNIVRKGVLFLRPKATLHEAIITSRTLGSDALWSNDNMYKHLSFLTSSFRTEHKTSSRMVIDTFFSRSTAMVPSSQKVIVVLENQISTVIPGLSQMDTISGVIDYTAVVVESSIAKSYISAPLELNQHHGNKMTAFFAVEAKDKDKGLDDHLPQVILELIACAKHLGKSHIRGALTTGFNWRFVVVDLDAGSGGAKYWVSELIRWRIEDLLSSVEETPDKSDPALIAGILSSWMLESFTEFNGDQWFAAEQEI